MAAPDSAVYQVTITHISLFNIEEKNYWKAGQERRSISAPYPRAFISCTSATGTTIS